MKNFDSRQIWLVSGLIFLAVIIRVLLYPFNFSPIIAIALFSGAVIKDKKIAFLLPLLAMFLSDVIFEVFNIAEGFWGWGQLVGYAILIGITFIGSFINKINVPKVAGFSILSSIVFFLLSNSSVWLLYSGMYENSFSGLVACIAAGVPFLKINLIADLVYSGLFFGTYELIRRNSFNSISEVVKG
ncbi:MAG: DUF6580 family putative transport protein [Ferruginibacter sp.]